MTCESEIDYVALVFYGLLNIRQHKDLKLLKVRDTPDHIVAEPDVVECRIHLRYSAQDPVKCSHSKPPFSQFQYKSK